MTADQVIALAAPLIALGGYALGQARWKGQIESRTEALEVKAKETRRSRRDIYAKLDHLETMFSELMGELRGRGVLNGRK